MKLTALNDSSDEEEEQQNQALYRGSENFALVKRNTSFFKVKAVRAESKGTANTSLQTRTSKGLSEYVAVDFSEIEEEADWQLNYLGQSRTWWERMASLFNFPRYFTSMYNENGRQVFTTRCGYFSCLGIILSSFYIAIFILYPLTSSQFQLETLVTYQLTNSIGLLRNHSSHPSAMEKMLGENRHVEANIPVSHIDEFISALEIRVANVSCSQIFYSWLSLEFLTVDVLRKPTCKDTELKWGFPARLLQGIKLGFDDEEDLERMHQQMLRDNLMGSYPIQTSFFVVFQSDLNNRTETAIDIYAPGVLYENDDSKIYKDDSETYGPDNLHFLSGDKVLMKFSVAEAIQQQSNHWGTSQIIFDWFDTTITSSAKVPDLDFYRIPRESGAFVVDFSFNDQYIILQEQAEYRGQLVNAGSTISLVHSSLIILRIFLAIKYRNWLGLRLLRRRGRGRQEKQSCFSKVILDWCWVASANKEREQEMGRRIDIFSLYEREHRLQHLEVGSEHINTEIALLFSLAADLDLQ